MALSLVRCERVENFHSTDEDIYLQHQNRKESARTTVVEIFRPGNAAAEIIKVAKYPGVAVADIRNRGTEDWKMHVRSNSKDCRAVPDFALYVHTPENSPDRCQ